MFWCAFNVMLSKQKSYLGFKMQNDEFDDEIEQSMTQKLLLFIIFIVNFIDISIIPVFNKMFVDVLRYPFLYTFVFFLLSIPVNIIIGIFSSTSNKTHSSVFSTAPAYIVISSIAYALSNALTIHCLSITYIEIVAVFHFLTLVFVAVLDMAIFKISINKWGFVGLVFTLIGLFTSILEFRDEETKQPNSSQIMALVLYSFFSSSSTLFMKLYTIEVKKMSQGPSLLDFYSWRKIIGLFPLFILSFLGERSAWKIDNFNGSLLTYSLFTVALNMLTFILDSYLNSDNGYQFKLSFNHLKCIPTFLFSYILIHKREWTIGQAIGVIISIGGMMTYDLTKEPYDEDSLLDQDDTEELLSYVNQDSDEDKQ